MPLDIKICGLKTPEALGAALTGGATHFGFIFFEKSPRNIAPEDAGRLRAAALGGAAAATTARQVEAWAVAVTVNADDAFLDAIVTATRPDMLQLHGNESPERVRDVKARHGLPVMKAFSIADAADLEKIEPYRGIADRFLFDAKPPKGADLPGGNGVSFDWEILAGLDPSIDYMLSGGLNADNIGEALRRVSPPGIDVSSGVETAPGVKDAGLLDDFFRAVRQA